MSWLEIGQSYSSLHLHVNSNHDTNYGELLAHFFLKKIIKLLLSLRCPEMIENANIYLRLRNVVQHSKGKEYLQTFMWKINRSLICKTQQK